jgi:hypothetical protein
VSVNVQLKTWQEVFENKGKQNGGGIAGCRNFVAPREKWLRRLEGRASIAFQKQSELQNKLPGRASVTSM